ncbi:lariat debranching enzyme [Drechmeria coniospora]|uniref:Lariat debranching enzyme n=1 Tax=Drechmeria coniospora TaxID=98403 RepID=A0A151GF13_DRECN|nr:lariat debranching enzyme [Drechmeria coniospora]KYK55687.1 lariat debranching enzyme [Drechmeria coniospora]
MSVPVKYRQLGDFPAYYSGERVAPFLTIFIAGNHEASSHLWELYYGGWVAPNIYYLGAANVLRFGPLRIAGLSGIWKGFDYRKPHHERLPFNSDDVKSFYHVREVDVRKLLMVQTQVDVGLSHDWPRSIEKHGDSEWLFRKKPDFRSESMDGTLGSVAAEFVMDRLRPPYWFSAHLHVKYAALKTYTDEEPRTMDAPTGAPESLALPVAKKEANPDEIDLDMDMDDDADADADKNDASHHHESPEVNASKAAEEVNTVSDELRAQLPPSFAPPPPAKPRRTPGQPVPPGITNKQVRFLALDKCLRGRHFLQLCDLSPFNQDELASHPPKDTKPRYRLQYDAEWLSITRVFHKTLTIGDRHAQVPEDLGEEHYLPLVDKERAWVEENLVDKGKMNVPDNFELTAPPHMPGHPAIVDEMPDEYTNPQTAAFCELRLPIFVETGAASAGVEDVEDVEDEEEEEEEEAGEVAKDLLAARVEGAGADGEAVLLRLTLGNVSSLVGFPLIWHWCMFMWQARKAKMAQHS